MYLDNVFQLYPKASIGKQMFTELLLKDPSWEELTGSESPLILTMRDTWDTNHPCTSGLFLNSSQLLLFEIFCESDEGSV